MPATEGIPFSWRRFLVRKKPSHEFKHILLNAKRPLRALKYLAEERTTKVEKKHNPTPERGLCNVGTQASKGILTLPVELLQLICTYLPQESVAAFALSCRYICHSVGREALYEFLRSSRWSKHNCRQSLLILERAFPSSWFCAWCDAFHRRDESSGSERCKPTSFRPCQIYNGYLHAGKDYIFSYHHARLALNYHLYGPDYGIPLSALRYVARVPDTYAELTVEYRILEARLLMLAVCTLHVPRYLNSPHRTKATKRLIGLFPQIVVGHSANSAGHLGLEHAILHALATPYPLDNVVSIQTLRHCGVCATDYNVSARILGTKSATAMGLPEPTTELTIKVWRDFGKCRSPFDSWWRAHGEHGGRKRDHTATAIMTAAAVSAENGAFGLGRIKHMFEDCQALR